MAVGFCRKFYSGDHHNPNNITIDQGLSSCDYVNNYINVMSPYSQIMNFRQDLNNLNSNVSSMKTKKRKLIVDSKGSSLKNQSKHY